MKRTDDHAADGHLGITPLKRPPKAQGPFRFLRPGSIYAEGWLGDYVRVIADGWTLHYARLKEHWLFSVLWERFQTPFPYPVEDQEAPDFCTYFTDGFLRLARMLPDSELRQLFGEWLEKVVASQDPGSYMGVLRMCECAIDRTATRCYTATFGPGMGWFPRRVFPLWCDVFSSWTHSTSAHETPGKGAG